MLKRYQGHLENKFIIFRVFLKCEVGIYPNFLQALHTWWAPPHHVFLISYHTVLWEFYYCETLVGSLVLFLWDNSKTFLHQLLSFGCTSWKGFLNIGEMMLNHLLTNFSVFLLKWLIYMRSVLWICPFLTFIYHDIFSQNTAANLIFIWHQLEGFEMPFSEVSWSNEISLIFTFQLLYKLAVPWVN